MEIDEMALRYAQVDVGLFADRKVRRLFRDMPEIEAYAALGVWMEALLDSWADEEPLQAVPPKGGLGLTEALVSVGLLDEDGRIPAEAWSKWFGPILEQRAKWREEKQRRVLPGSARNSPEPVGTGSELRESSPSPSPSPSTSSSSSLREDSAKPREEPPAIATPGDDSPGLDEEHYILTNRVLRGRAVKWARELEDKHGTDEAIAVMRQTMAETMDADNLLSLTADRLQLAANARNRKDEKKWAAVKEEERQQAAVVAEAPWQNPDLMTSPLPSFADVMASVEMDSEPEDAVASSGSEEVPAVE